MRFHPSKAVKAALRYTESDGVAVISRAHSQNVRMPIPSATSALGETLNRTALVIFHTVWPCRSWLVPALEGGPSSYGSDKEFNVSVKKLGSQTYNLEMIFVVGLEVDR